MSSGISTRSPVLVLVEPATPFPSSEKSSSVSLPTVVEGGTGDDVCKDDTNEDEKGSVATT